MALLIECPKCKRRCSAKSKKCKCGIALAKLSGKVYWIAYYEHGRLRRERIGPSRLSAEQRLREVLTARTENRYIRRNPDAKTNFRTLAEWYLSLPEVKAKRSYNRDKGLLKNLLPFFWDKLLQDITPTMIESYKLKRLAEPSGRTPATLTAPATVNREIACLKAIFNKGIKNAMAEANPCKMVKLLKENNERTRVLSPDEYVRLLAHCSPQVKPIVQVAYHTGMRQSEILHLVWDRVDLKNGRIRLKPEDCKTGEGRDVYLNREMMELFRSMPQGLPGVRVFQYKGKAFGSTFQKAFNAAKEAAGITDFVFHDLRHTYVTERDREGHSHFVIMAQTGHKTLHMLKRYRAVKEDDLRALVGGYSPNPSLEGSKEAGNAR